LLLAPEVIVTIDCPTAAKLIQSKYKRGKGVLHKEVAPYRAPARPRVAGHPADGLCDLRGHFRCLLSGSAGRRYQGSGAGTARRGVVYLGPLLRPTNRSASAACAWFGTRKTRVGRPQRPDRPTNPPDR